MRNCWRWRDVFDCVAPQTRLVLVPRMTPQALARCTPPQELAQRKHSTTRLKHATSKRTSLLVHRQEVSTHKFHCLIQRQEVSTHISTVSSPSWLGRPGSKTGSVDTPSSPSFPLVARPAEFQRDLSVASKTGSVNTHFPLFVPLVTGSAKFLLIPMPRSERRHNS